jgi:hypothetical protein
MQTNDKRIKNSHYHSIAIFNLVAPISMLSEVEADNSFFIKQGSIQLKTAIDENTFE